MMSPDCFTGTMSADEAAAAMSAGWLDTCGDDQVEIIPLSDGGPGFIDSVVRGLGATRQFATVRGPLGDNVVAQYAILGTQAWIESAQACGLNLIESDDRNPRITSTYGVGELIRAAVEAGCRTVTVGLGGTGTNDGGAGALAALGAVCTGGTLSGGGSGLLELESVDLALAVELLSDVTLIIATDVDNPLLGLRGATNTFARQKGADDDDIMHLEGAMEHFAKLCAKRPDGKDPAVALGAGAAGGLGYSLLHLGASRVAGIDTVLDIVGFDDLLRSCDLVITGEGCLDDQSLSGKVVAGVAHRARTIGKPCVAISGVVRLGKREASTAGIDSTYSMSELVGLEKSMSEPQVALREVTARVAKTWGRL